MSQIDLADGFEYWKTEVEELAQPEADFNYTPIIALVGIYTVFMTTEEHNSYNWRQAVLKSKDAITGLRLSLPSMFAESIDDTYENTVEELEPPKNSALQHICAHTSLLDGMPQDVKVVPENEWFLARTLGYAEHDYAVAFKPLRLSDGGEYSIKAHYPRTARLIGKHQ